MHAPAGVRWELLRVGFESLPPCYLSNIWGGASNLKMPHKHVLSELLGKGGEGDGERVACESRKLGKALDFWSIGPGQVCLSLLIDWDR